MAHEKSQEWQDVSAISLQSQVMEWCRAVSSIVAWVTAVMMGWRGWGRNAGTRQPRRKDHETRHSSPLHLRLYLLPLFLFLPFSSPSLLYLILISSLSVVTVALNRCQNLMPALASAVQVIQGRMTILRTVTGLTYQSFEEGAWFTNDATLSQLISFVFFVSNVRTRSSLPFFFLLYHDLQ